MNTDQLAGRLGVLLGGWVGQLGRTLHRPPLEREGRCPRLLGRARAGYGDAVAAVARRGR